MSGSGWVDLGSDPLSWKTDELAATNVLLSKDLGKKLRFVLPIFHMGTGRDGEMSGRLSATITVKGKGTSGEVLKKSLDGHGRITLDTVTVEGSPIMKVLTLQVESLFQGDSFKFDRATVDFKIHKQRVDIPNGVMIEGPSYPIEFKRGTAFFDGTIDFDIAVKRYPIPLKLKGTFDHPKVRLRKPKLSDLFPR